MTEPGAYNNESRYRFGETNRATGLQRHMAYTEAVKRLTGDQLTATRKWIYYPNRSVWQLRQLYKRWGLELPHDWDGLE